jgi:hypothetical protein
MSTPPERRFASSAAVFSMARTTMRLNPGFFPPQAGFGSSTICEPGAVSVMR